MQFYRFGNLCAPVPFLIVSLGINVEMVQEGLHVILILDGHEVGFKILVEV